MTKILFCVLHTHHYRDRYNSIMSTWGKKKDIIFYADYDDPKINNIIKVTNNDSYHSNEEKNINVFKILNQQFNNYDWYFFCDDDTFVNTKNLNDLINSEINTDHIHGLVANSWKDKSLWYCGGGAGYLVSNNILTNYLCDAVNFNTGYSDVSVGLNCRKFNIGLSHHEGFNSFPPNDERNISKVKTVDHAITFHYIKTLQQMQTLYNDLKSKGINNENR